MEYRKLGSSPLVVSTVGFGAWGIAGGPMWGSQDERDSIKALHAAVDAGITFFDTAEVYGDGYSEEVLGRAFGKGGKRIVVATKVSPSNLEPEALVRSCEASLRRLRRETIDLYQIHWPPRGTAPDSVIETFGRLVDAGKIRCAGVSNFGPADLAPYPAGLFVSNQVAYSVAFRAVEHSVLPATIGRSMSAIAYSPLLHGILTGDYRTADEVPAGRGRTRHFSSSRTDVRHGEPGHEEALFALIDAMRALAAEAGVCVRELAVAWVASRPGVATVLAGSRTAAQAVENAAVADVKVEPEILDRLTSASEPLRTALGPNPDMWQSESRVGV